MDDSRRRLLTLTAGAVAAAALSPRARAARRTRFGAVAFDAFPIFDPRPIAARAEEVFPGKGGELMALWRARQFEYTWLRTLGGRYQDFWRTTQEALTFAAASMKLQLPATKRDHLMHAYLELAPWPDVPAALEALRRAGIRMAFLSNFTARMLDVGVARAGLTGVFEPHLSTDRVRAFKPHPRAYEMGVDAFRLARDEVLFVASAAWDAAGARWFGYPTLWVNRTGAPDERLGAAPDPGSPDLGALVELVGA